MIKKIIAVAGAAGILVSMTMPVLAGRGHHFRRTSDVDVANVTNSATAGAYTGGNSQHNSANANMGIGQEAEVEGGDDRYIRTGDADADAKAVVIANTDISCGRRGQDPCPCPDEVYDEANVINGAGAEADTGLNGQDDSADANMGIGQEAEVETGHRSDRTIKTGDADSDADAWVVVNTDLRGGGGRRPR